MDIIMLRLYKNGENVLGDGLRPLGKKYNNLVDDYTDVARNRLGQFRWCNGVQHFAAPIYSRP